jgi:hypothetical protein
MILNLFDTVTTFTVPITCKKKTSMSVVWLNFDRSNTSEVKFNLYSVVAINWFIFLRVTLTRFPLIKSSIPTQIKARSLDSR